jgi:hypothetical protein
MQIYDFAWSGNHPNYVKESRFFKIIVVWETEPVFPPSSPPPPNSSSSSPASSVRYFFQL